MIAGYISAIYPKASSRFPAFDLKINNNLYQSNTGLNFVQLSYLLLYNKHNIQIDS